MRNKMAIVGKGTPKATGPFSPAILYQPKYELLVSGQLGLDSIGNLVEGLEAQTEQALYNVQAHLSVLGWGPENILGSGIYITDMGPDNCNYKTVNDIYKEMFDSAPKPAIYPARTFISTGLPLHKALVEIDCIAGGDKILKHIKRELKGTFLERISYTIGKY